MLRLLLLPLALLCCGAAQKVRVGLDQVPPGSKCVHSAALDSFIGQQASAQLGAQMMAAAQARSMRWATPGTSISPKYDSKRLTVRLDEHGRVVAASCS